MDLPRALKEIKTAESQLKMNDVVTPLKNAVTLHAYKKIYNIFTNDLKDYFTFVVESFMNEYDRKNKNKVDCKVSTFPFGHFSLHQEIRNDIGIKHFKCTFNEIMDSVHENRNQDLLILKMGRWPNLNYEKQKIFILQHNLPRSIVYKSYVQDTNYIHEITSLVLNSNTWFILHEDHGCLITILLRNLCKPFTITRIETKYLAINLPSRLLIKINLSFYISSVFYEDLYHCCSNKELFNWTVANYEILKQWRKLPDQLLYLHKEADDEPEVYIEVHTGQSKHYYDQDNSVTQGVRNCSVQTDYSPEFEYFIERQQKFKRSLSELLTAPKCSTSAQRPVNTNPSINGNIFTNIYQTCNNFYNYNFLQSRFWLTSIFRPSFVQSGYLSNSMSWKMTCLVCKQIKTAMVNLRDKWKKGEYKLIWMLILFVYTLYSACSA